MSLKLEKELSSLPANPAATEKASAVAELETAATKAAASLQALEEELLRLSQQADQVEARALDLRQQQARALQQKEEALTSHLDAIQLEMRKAVVLVFLFVEPVYLRNFFPKGLKSQGADPPPPRVAKASKSNLNKEITPLLPTGIGER